MARLGSVKAGMRFGKLTAKYPTKVKNRFQMWMCVCDCGIEKEVRGSHLSYGSIRACGCEGGIKTHGLKKHPLYGIWQHMITRCYE